MAAALRFRSFQEAVNNAAEGVNLHVPVKGQTQVFVRHDSGQETVAEVLVDDDNNLVILTKEALDDLG